MNSDPIDPEERKPRRGDTLTVVTDSLDTRGQAVGTIERERWGAFHIKLRHQPPGARLTAEVLRRRGAFVDGRVLEVLEPGPEAREARCRHFGNCGGCATQTTAYSRQLVELSNHVRAALVETGVLGDATVEPVIGMDDPWRYRNKMDFTFGSKRWVEPDEPEDVPADFAVGLHAPGRHDKVLDIHECRIAFEEAERIVASARELAQEQGLSAWDIHAQSGLLRHLVLRKGFATGEILAFLVTDPNDTEKVTPFVEALLARHPELTTLVHGISARAAKIAASERETIHRGEGFIHDELAGVRFRISAQSFFQTNTVQAERLVEVVREEAGLTGEEVLWDLYSGAGTLGLCLANAAREVVGIESVASSIADARQNAARNGIENVRFLEGDVRHTLEQASAEGSPPDVAVVDPPRAGLHPKVVPAVARLGARRLVYVSCNIRSAARDLEGLLQGGYSLTRVRPLDLFPHTPHVESVLTLERLP